MGSTGSLAALKQISEATKVNMLYLDYSVEAAYKVVANKPHPFEKLHSVELTCKCDSVPNAVTGCTSDTIKEYTWTKKTKKDATGKEVAKGKQHRKFTTASKERKDT